MNIKELPNGVCAFSALMPYLLTTRNAARIPQNAKSVICFLFPYYLGEENYKDRNVSRYAVPADYHGIAGEILNGYCGELSERYPSFKFEPFLDNSPVPEVYAATLCGLGFKGRNGLLINPGYGSFCFIGEIITDMEMTPSEPCVSGCADCGKCENACPAGALSDGKPDREKCLSAVTQQKKELTAEQEEMIAASGICWGCDVCQEVCPYNRSPRVTPVEEFVRTAVPRVCDDTDITGRAYEWRGEKVIKRNIGILKR